MNISAISGAIIPVFLALVMLYGWIKGVKVFDVFLLGAKEGIMTAFSILPAVLALVVCVSMLKSSGALSALSSLLSPVFEFAGIPKETAPIALIRPLSGSGAIAVIDDIFKNHGPDSFAGKVASVMMGSSETTFYTIAVYFGAVSIKKSRHTLLAALSTDAAAFIFAAAFTRLLLG